ncbi:pilus assembly protein TadG-related protein [Amycolatopsis sp. NPDC059657]|uniref:pilus assembly protein TadG-related protein n=1 Tax=Amycolatopsis sp. NPDC059657 TaxID=3346899 RepID=UPI003671C502
MTPARSLRDLRGDRGSASVWLIGLSVALAIAIGGAVDGSRKAQAHSQATAIAEEAARAAGQALRAQSLATGRDADVNPELATAEARAYINATGATGIVSVQGTRIEVETTITKPTVFLGMIGIAEITVHGHGTANLISAG